MNIDEIKAQYSMQDIVQMYGFQPNRAGFIHCPFHSGDRTSSCKIYLKDYHCHACGANGDIFDFVAHMDNCSFKDAYKKLGGTYEQSDERKRAEFKVKMESRKNTRLRKIMRLKHEIRGLAACLEYNRIGKDIYEPFSDNWCEAVNRFEREYYQYTEKIRELKEFKS